MLLGCPPPGTDPDSSGGTDDYDGPNPQQYGSVVINLASNLKTIEPPLDMNIDSYYVSATGPGAPFSTTVDGSETSVTIPSLLAGDWSIAVVARNTVPENIGGGTDDSVTVIPGEVTPCTIVVLPFEGTGTLSLSVSWPADDVATPSITATMAPLGGSAGAIDFSATGNPRTYEDTWDAGYYELNLGLYEASTKVWGTAAVVRIIADQTSSKDFVLTSSDINPMTEGDVAITIEPELQNSIEVSFDSTPSTYLIGDPDMSIVASTDPEDTGSYAYKWYLNGGLLAETSNTLSIGSGLSEGNYTVDLVVPEG